MRLLKHKLALTIALGLVLISGGGAFVYLGVYNVSALEQHTLPVYRLLQYAMRRAVAVRNDAVVPPLDELDWQGRGLRLYEAHCEQCHGNPGVAPASFSLGMVPAPTAIQAIGRDRSPGDIYWVIKHGIKMTGMPAWDYRLGEADIWQVVAYIRHMPTLTVDDYRQLRERAHASTPLPLAHDTTTALPEDRAEQILLGRVALQQYNCISCHRIPGVTAGSNHVGPPLGGITTRAFIAGVLPYSEANLVRWIRFPQDVDPATTMPNLGVTQVHAQAMVAYLQSIDKNGD